MVLAAALARRAAARPAGIAAAALAATSPYLIWYGQELRSYALAGLLALVLLHLGREAARPRRGARPRLATGRRVPIAAAVFSAAALYIHYLCGFVAVALGNMAFLAHWLASPPDSQRRRRLVAWIGSQVVAGAVFLPWLVYARESLSAWPATSPPISITFVVLEALRRLSVGTGLERDPVPLVAGLRHFGLGASEWVLSVAFALVFAMVLVAGAVYLLRSSRPWSTSMVTAVLAAPIVLWLLALTRPAWNPKFLVTSAGAFEALLGIGVLTLARASALRSADRIAWRTANDSTLGFGGALPGGGSAGRVVRGAGRVPPPTAEALGRGTGIGFAALLATLLLPRLIALSAVASEPGQQRDDYAGIARVLNAGATPGDAAILTAPTQIEVLGFYSPTLLTRPIPLIPLPEERPPDAEKLTSTLDAIGDSHHHLYGVLWATDEADPTGIVEGWLNRHRAKAWERWFGNIRLGLWIRPYRDRMDSASAPVEFGDSLRLDRVLYGPSVASPRTNVAIDADWTAVREPPVDYVVLTQLLSREGALAVGRDMGPSGGSDPTSTWQPGSRHSDSIGIDIPVELAPGTYTLILGLYDPATGERLIPEAAADSTVDIRVEERVVVIGQVTVVADRPPLE